MRKLNKGVLPSVLGVDGYNPSAVQYEAKVDELPNSTSTSTDKPVVAPVAPVVTAPVKTV